MTREPEAFSHAAQVAAKGVQAAQGRGWAKILKGGDETFGSGRVSGEAVRLLHQIAATFGFALPKGESPAAQWKAARPAIELAAKGRAVAGGEGEAGTNIAPPPACTCEPSSAYLHALRGMSREQMAALLLAAGDYALNDDMDPAQQAVWRSALFSLYGVRDAYELGLSELWARSRPMVLEDTLGQPLDRQDPATEAVLQLLAAVHQAQAVEPRDW